MSDEEDDFDAAFGDAEDIEEGSSDDAEESAGAEGEGEGEEGQGSDEEDFSKDWGELPDEPVKFGGKGKLLGILKKVGISLAIISVLGGGGFGVYSNLDTITGLFESSGEDENSGNKKKKKKKKKKKTRSRPSVDDSDGRPMMPGGDEAEAADEGPIDLVTGTVKVSVKGKAVLWVDGVSVGKTKKKMKIEVEVGEHRFLVVSGKKQLWLKGQVEDGKNYDLKFDFRKSKKSFEEAAAKGRKRRKKR